MFLNKEQQAQVREHLTKVLQEFSDADSNILSDYIVALLAKEGTEVQVRHDCSSELSAFMNEKTEQFVVQLFEFINKSIKRGGGTARRIGNRSITITEPSAAAGAGGDKGNISVVIRHKRNVEVHNSKTQEELETTKAAAVAASKENTTAQPQPQQDFAVSTTPTPPNAQRNQQNVASSVSPSHAMSSAATATGVRPQPGAYANQSYYPRNNRRHNVHPTMRPMNLAHAHAQALANGNGNVHGNGNTMAPGHKDNANLQTLNQLLSIVQQNIQHAQHAHQLSHPNKAFVAANRSMPIAMPMQSGLGPTIFTGPQPYVPRPILQHTPNIIPSGGGGGRAQGGAPTRPRPVPSRPVPPRQVAPRPGALANAAAGALAQPPPPRMPLPQQRLDEVRLPPNSNPFYQDNRFSGRQHANNNNNFQGMNHHNHNHNNRMMVGTKRNFSKMNSSRDNQHHNHNNNQKDGGKKFETAQHEKRQLYVYNIPPHLCVISRLTSHFQQFGDIQNIQVHRDSNRAYVQFATHDEALEALNHPDDILGENAIQTAWAYYNRPDFERNATKPNANSAHDQNNNNNASNYEAHASPSFSAYSHAHPMHGYSRSQSQSHTPSVDSVVGGGGGGVQHRAVSHQWVSAEYRQKMSTGSSPPTKKQKVGGENDGSVDEEQKVPKDVSANIEQLKSRLGETMTMFETLLVNSGKPEDDETASDKKELQNSVKQTIESIESQLKKLIAHQKQRNDALAKLKAAKANKASTSANSRGKAKPFGGGYRPRRPFSTYAPNPMMMMRGGGGMYGGWRGRGRGRGGAKYRAITRKSRVPHNKYLAGGYGKPKIDFSGKSVDFRSSSLIIGGLPSKVDEAELRRHFLCFAEVDSIDLFSKDNLAVIKFKKRSDAERALMKGKSFKSSVNESCDLKLRFIEGEELSQLINKRKKSKTQQQSNTDESSAAGVASEPNGNGDDHADDLKSTNIEKQDDSMYNDLNTEKK